MDVFNDLKSFSLISAEFLVMKQSLGTEETTKQSVIHCILSTATSGNHKWQKSPKILMTKTYRSKTVVLGKGKGT